jgi:hypothetical protein
VIYSLLHRVSCQALTPHGNPHSIRTATSLGILILVIRASAILSQFLARRKHYAAEEWVTSTADVLLNKMKRYLIHEASFSNTRFSTLKLCTDLQVTSVAVRCPDF